MAIEREAWCVCGQEADGPWKALEVGLADYDAACEWLRTNHRRHPEMTAFYADRESNEGHAESYFDRAKDGSLVKWVGCDLVAFAE
jgi:uncharacterized short protein YbdD (DUF466 family)